MNAFLSAAADKGTVMTPIKVALVVGTFLALINYGDRIFLRHDMRLLDWIKLALRYLPAFQVGPGRTATEISPSERQGLAFASPRVI